MNVVQLLARAFAMLALIVLPLVVALSHLGVSTFAIVFSAVIVQCSAVLYLLRRRKP